MTKIQVGSTTTKYGPNGEVTSVSEQPSYLINEDGTKTALTKEEAKEYGIGRESSEKRMDLQEFASLEAMMFRQIEIRDTKAALQEEYQLNNKKISDLLRSAEMNEYTAKFNENFDIKAAIVQDRQKMFDKDKMADDLGVKPAVTQQKDFLINMTEKGKLTLEQFKKYFFYEPTVKLTVSKVKIKKSSKRRNK